MKSRTDSAVPGTFETVDLEQIHQRALRRTWDEITRPAPQIERKDDGRDWARLVLARIERGESIGLQAELYAREALGMAPPGTLPAREPGEDAEA